MHFVTVPPVELCSQHHRSVTLIADDTKSSNLRIACSSRILFKWLNFHTQLLLLGNIHNEGCFLLTKIFHYSSTFMQDSFRWVIKMNYKMFSFRFVAFLSIFFVTICLICVWVMTNAISGHEYQSFRSSLLQTCSLLNTTCKKLIDLTIVTWMSSLTIVDNYISNFELQWAKWIPDVSKLLATNLSLSWQDICAQYYQNIYSMCQTGYKKEILMKNYMVERKKIEKSIVFEK